MIPTGRRHPGCVLVAQTCLPLVVETSEEILRSRLRHPTRLSASDDLDEGRNIMVGAELWPAAERAGRVSTGALLARFLGLAHFDDPSVQPEFNQLADRIRA